MDTPKSDFRLRTGTYNFITEDTNLSDKYFAVSILSMAFAFHPGKKNELRKESGSVSKKNNLLSSSPQSEI